MALPHIVHLNITAEPAVSSLTTYDPAMEDCIKTFHHPAQFARSVNKTTAKVWLIVQQMSKLSEFVYLQVLNCYS